MAGLKTRLKLGTSLAALISLGVVTIATGGGSIPAGDDFFAELGSTSTWYANSTWPSAIYSASDNKTLVAIEDFTVVGGVSTKQVRLYGYDHTAKSWLPSVDLYVDASTGTGTQPEADDHGGGAWTVDYQNYKHVFGGAHNQAMQHVCSNNATDLTGFTAQATIGTTYAYPHPVSVGSQINLFCRSFNGTLQYNLILRRTSALSAGAATWGSELPVLSFGDNTRVYLGQSIAVGTDIYLVCTQADFGDTLRKHVYVLVYDTVTGNVRNLANTKTVLAASLPVGLSDADTFFRVVGFAGGEEGVTPSMCIENGRLHIGYIQGVDGAANVRHRYFDLATGAQQGGVNELGSTNNPRNTVTIAPGAVGIEARWTTNVGAVSEYQTNDLPAVAYASGGDMWGASWSIGGGWAASAKIRAATRAHKVDSPNYVFNAHPDIRWMYAERASDTQYKLGGNLRSFAYGDSGIVKRDWGDETEVTAWIARRSAPPASDLKSAINAMVRVHKGCGAWPIMDGMYVGIESAALADAMQNLKANNFNQTTGGTIALDGAKGAKSDGVSGYSDTGYNPTTSGGQFAATNFLIASWLLTDGQSSGYDIGCGSLASIRTQALSATNTRNARAANTTVITAAETSALGEFGVRRTGNTGAFVNDGSGVNSTALTVPGGEVSPNGNLTFHKNASAFASRAHGLQFFGAYQPPDMYGVGYQARKRFMIERGLV
ncbi:hypothetical protein HLI01_08730 [Rhizobium laguerreae]|uniref:BNR-4 repeat-containing protein n=1 Tax=Rhizobium laguerreae TaxID=1076926 RepID=UPI0014793D8E|nr:BNR-4 repeat-containing protein [Rhizobium laguerreae]NNH56891.1 hypothetical protein [Rhizobium laguerreae]